MMRASASPTAPYYAVLLNPGGSATVQWRSYDGTPSTTAKLSVPSLTSPAYIEIVRWTDASANPPQTYFSTLTSTDGTTWTPVLGSTEAIEHGLELPGRAGRDVRHARSHATSDLQQRHADPDEQRAARNLRRPATPATMSGPTSCQVTRTT